MAVCRALGRTGSGDHRGDGDRGGVDDVIYEPSEARMRWKFSTGTELAAEHKVVAKMRAASNFYRFLFDVREELFDDELQDMLAGAFDPRGQQPVAPALLAMVNLPASR